MLSIATIAYAIADVPEIAGMTLDMVRALRANTIDPFEHIMIFNGEKFTGWPEGYIPKEVVFHKHMSISTCYNVAFKYRAEGDYLCCCHNDVFVEPGWSEPLIEEAKKGSIAFPTIEEVNYKGHWPLGSACFVMHKDVWEDLGGYDEDFKGCHYEDEDLFLRATQRGIPLVQLSNSHVKHLRRVTRQLVPFKQDEQWVAINHPIFIGKHGDEGVRWLKNRWGKMNR